MHINEVMTHPVITCPMDSTADVPARLMWEFDCGVIPLVDGEGRLAGIITDRDLCMAAMTQAKPFHEIAVTSAMANDVVRCHPEDPIETVERQMSHYRIRRVPVVDAENRPVGMVTVNDLARLASRAKRSVVDRELVRAMAEICHPRGRAVPVQQEPARTNRHALVSV
jgi:CBS domain-containing protein